MIIRCEYVSNLSIFEHFCHPIFAHNSIKKAAEAGRVADFIEKPIPVDWRKWPLDKRRDYWAGACKGQNIPTVQRKYICAIEVWCECFNHAPADMSKANAREINATLNRLQGWQKSCVDARPYSSTARGFSRKPMQLV